MQAAIARAQAERAARLRITQDDVLERLLRETDREGEGASHGARVSAIVALGKHLGMFTERTEHSMSADLISMGRALSEMASRTPGNLSTDPRVLARLKGSGSG